MGEGLQPGSDHPDYHVKARQVFQEDQQRAAELAQKQAAAQEARDNVELLPDGRIIIRAQIPDYHEQDSVWAWYYANPHKGDQALTVLRFLSNFEPQNTRLSEDEVRQHLNLGNTAVELRPMGGSGYYEARFIEN